MTVEKDKAFNWKILFNKKKKNSLDFKIGKYFQFPAPGFPWAPKPTLMMEPNC